jgi:carbon storage regulator
LRYLSVRELIGFKEIAWLFTPRRNKGRPAMLVLSRRVGERIFFPAIGAYVKVLSVEGATVRLGIEAPREVRILREELQNRVRSDNRVDAEYSSLFCG